MSSLEPILELLIMMSFLSCVEPSLDRPLVPPKGRSTVSATKGKASARKPASGPRASTESVIEQLTDLPPPQQPPPSLETSIGLGTIGSTFLESLLDVPASLVESEPTPGSPLHFDIFSKPSEDLRTLSPFLRLSPPGRSSGDVPAEKEVSGATSESDYASGADTPTFGVAAIIMSFSANVTQFADSTSFAEFFSFTSPEVSASEVPAPLPMSQVAIPSEAPVVLTESTVVTSEIVPQVIEPVKEVGEEDKGTEQEEGEYVEEEAEGGEEEEEDDEELVNYESDGGYYSDPPQVPSPGLQQTSSIQAASAAPPETPVETLPRTLVTTIDVM